ncbi:MAG: MBOAT family protein [Elusimicrobia bacterium]|nr:MBOAT family protein [Elusimicrobiota bacterium]
MLFNSLAFLVFFPVVSSLYFLLPYRWRWLLLLLASCVFYMWLIPAYILVLAVTIAIDYTAGILIEDSSSPRVKRASLIASVLSTCLVLFIFKYFNFFNANLHNLSAFLGYNYPLSLLKLILPVGLSFHTFQSLSYVIEVYNGRQKAERNFGIYSLYVMFYPQLVAGPIERPQNLLHQFYEKHDFNYQDAVDGLKLMAWGMFKKVVVADRLAVVVNHVYDAPTAYTGAPLLLATIFFSYQIYCDFSGYSDIARGAARFMGFRLMRNFNIPYYSRSVGEFWKRWHISLSTWFKDYLYIPLGGSRCTAARQNFNLFFTFLVSGLWHGANWTYVVWGALNGAYLVAERALSALGSRLTGGRAPRLPAPLRVAVTFSLITFAWVFFRANTISDAFYIVAHMFDGLGRLDSLAALRRSVGGLGLMPFEFGVALGSLVLLEAMQLVQARTDMRLALSAAPVSARWLMYAGLTYVIMVFGAFSNNSKFIYFQF